MKFRNSVEECNKTEIEKFINEHVRVKSDKTGKMIKVNTFKWTKNNLVEFVKKYNFTKQCLEYVNYYYNDLPRNADI